MALCCIDTCPVEVRGPSMVCAGCWQNVPQSFRRYVEKKFAAGGVTVGEIMTEISDFLEEVRDKGAWRSYVHPRQRRAA